jgi:hypothetical protein
VTTPPLTAPRWFARALSTALVLMVAFAALGFLVAWWSRWAAFGLGGALTLVVAAPWALARIGATGLAAALLGMVSLLLSAQAGAEWWVVSRVVVVDAPSVEAWPGAALALRLPSPLRHVGAWRGAASWETRSGKGGAVRHARAATPLVAAAEGPVVAFDCHEPDRDPDADGPVALSWSAWAGRDVGDCSRPIAGARARVLAAGGTLAPGAEARVVRVFRDEAALRAAVDAKTAVGLPGCLFGLYALLCAVFMRAGARSVR